MFLLFLIFFLEAFIDDDENLMRHHFVFLIVGGLQIVKSTKESGSRPVVSMAATKLQAFWNHPAGPKTSEFFSLGFNLAFADLSVKQ